MAGFDIKEKIERNVKKAVADFQERDDITTKFGEPVLAYVYAKDPLFGMFWERQLCKHPKAIFQPGNKSLLAMRAAILRQNSGKEHSSNHCGFRWSSTESSEVRST